MVNGNTDSWYLVRDSDYQMFFVKSEDVLNIEFGNTHYVTPIASSQNNGLGRITNKVALDISKFSIDTYGRDCPNEDEKFNSRLINDF